jgi:hypothetical protein
MSPIGDMTPWGHGRREALGLGQTENGVKSYPQLDFCEDWVEQLHQLGLKNNRRTKTIRDRDRKYKLYTHWEQLSGNRDVQRIKKEVHKNRKRKLDTTRGLDTQEALLLQKSYHRDTALEQDNTQWTGENRLLSPEEIIRLDAADRLLDV